VLTSPLCRFPTPSYLPGSPEPDYSSGSNIRSLLTHLRKPKPLRFNLHVSMITTTIAPLPVRKRRVDTDLTLGQKGKYTHVKVSAVIITFNEEKIIRKTLSKLYWCDEIIIVDSHSTDNTVSICQEFGCKVFLRSFDGYGAQKRFAVSKAKNDWLLCIDADEVLTDALVAELIDNLQATPSVAGFSLPMNLVFLDKEFTRGKESGRYFLRLFNKQKGGISADIVHEKLQVEGEIKKLKNIIQHYSYTSVQQYLDKLNRYSTYTAEIAFKRGKKKSVGAVLFSIPFNFFKYFIIERNCLNGLKGFYWSVFSSLYNFAKYIKLRDLYKNQ
jgi:glycosyltransferase involved in cell wall biosynthesis